MAALLAVIGPGIITGSVDNDAGGITTYSVAGALYGYNLIWTLVPSFVVLFIVQEMNARMGIVTGKGLADLIRENFGIKITFLVFFCMLIANLGNTTTEFAGVAGSLDIFGISKYVSVPLSAIAVWVLVVKSNYKTAERVFILFSFALLSYVFSALMAKPDWQEISQATLHPTLTYDTEYLAMVIALVGTTIAPWMQFYMQSSVIEKGLRIEDYRYSVLDVLVGCVATVVVAFFIMVACGAVLFPKGIEISTAKDAAESLRPLAGHFAAELFAFGLFVASIFSATILPLASAFCICSAFGFEAGIDKKLNEAPEFYQLYTGTMLIGALIVLIPDAPLISITLWTQVINGILLPVVLIAMLKLINNPEIMGEHVNGKIWNWTTWIAVSILCVLSSILLILNFI